jgi:hypothetical protein
MPEPSICDLAEACRMPWCGKSRLGAALRPISNHDLTKEERYVINMDEQRRGAGRG